MQEKRVRMNGDGLLTNFRYRRKWKRITFAMAVLVVMATISSLMLPAITLNQDLCGLTEHSHSTECYFVSTERTLACNYETLGIHKHKSDCYDAEDNAICNQVDFVVHTHDRTCLNKDSILVCTLKEVIEHRHKDSCYQVTETVIDEGHAHSDVCYEYVASETPACGTEESTGHQHGDSCYATGTELICTETEESGHTHSNECYTETETLTCGCEETLGHAHGDTCYGEDGILACGMEEYSGHAHESACYTLTSTLVCTTQERTGHTHGTGCFMEAGTLLCNTEESAGHQHDETCFGQVRGNLICTEEEREATVEAGEPVLICGKLQVILHTHKSGCYEYDAQGNPVSVICGKPEVIQHQHTDACFTEHEDKTLICDIPEHTHTDECRGSTGLSDEEQIQVEAMILVIDELPDTQEVNAQFAVFDETDDTAGREACISALTEQVVPAFAQYDALTEEQKAAVTNASRLMALKWLLDENTLEKEAEQARIDEVVAQIDCLLDAEALTIELAALTDARDLIGWESLVNDVTQKTQIARSLYDALPAQLQEAVSNLQKLTDVEAILAEAQAPSLTEEEKVSVDELIALIDSLPTLEELAAQPAAAAEEQADTALGELISKVKEARDTYNNMNSVQQAAVTNEPKLAALEEQLGLSCTCGTENGIHTKECPLYDLYSVLCAAKTAEELYDLLLNSDREELLILTLEEIEKLWEIAEALPYENEDTRTALFAMLEMLKNGTSIQTLAVVDSVTITDSIVEDGKIYAVVSPEGTEAACKYTWTKSTDGGATFEEVITNDSADRPNIRENWLNVVYDNEVDGELQAVSGIQYRVSVTSEGTKEATFTVPDLSIEIQNGGFESPQADSDTFWYARPESAVPYWNTSATDNQIELVKTNPSSQFSLFQAYANYGIGTLNGSFVGITSNGTSAFEKYIEAKGYTFEAADDAQPENGTVQFAEINAEQPSALYQSVLTRPGSTLNWQLAHMARYYAMGFNQRGVALPDRTAVQDTMYVVIMSDKGAEEVISTGSGTQQEKLKSMISAVGVGGGTYTVPGTGNSYPVYICQITSDAMGWHAYQGTYTVPSNQYYTCFFFVAGSTNYDQFTSTDKIGTGGNFIDAVSFSSKIPPAILNRHSLTIHYVDELGNKLADDHFKSGLTNGTSYSVSSPEITGYTLVNFEQAIIAGAMGTRDLEFTVVYRPNPATLTISKQVLADDGNVLSIIPDISYQFQLEVSKNGEEFHPTTEFKCVSNGSVISPDENGIYTIKAGQSVQFQGVTLYDEGAVQGTQPTQVRIVEILETDPYSVTRTDIDGKGIEPDENKKIVSSAQAVTAGGELTYEVTNYLAVERLVIKKLLTGNGLSLLPEDQAFQFNLKLADAANETITAMRSGSTSEVLTIGTNHTYAFSLKENETLTLERVPSGMSYELSETNPALEHLNFEAPAYTLTVAGETEGSPSLVPFTSSFERRVQPGGDNVVTVTNSLIGDFVTLPETGGAGTYLYMFGGWAMITVACVLMHIIRHKKRKGAR